MNDKRHDARPEGKMGDGAAHGTSLHRCTPARRGKAGILSDPRFQFDTDAWAALLEEQRLLIASAAGVEPSKVRIQVGH